MVWFSEANHFHFLLSHLPFKPTFSFISQCFCLLVPMLRKPASIVTDKTKRKVKDANEKDEDENDSPLKTQPMQKRHFASLFFLQPLFCDV